MGWKNIKDAYRIGHFVQVTEAGICIGSGCISDLMVIGLDGELKKCYDGANANLIRYQREMDADPERLKQLAQSPGTFEIAIPVYTYQGGQIIEKHCEALGWPNMTHDGELMCENTFYADRAAAIAAAKNSADCRTEWFKQQVEEAKAALVELEASLAKSIADRAALDLLQPED